MPDRSALFASRMQLRDLVACNDLCVRVHGHDRGGELSDAIQQGAAVVAESRGRVTAYASSVAFLGHAVLCARIRYYRNR